MLDPRDMSRDRDVDARDRAYECRERSDDPLYGLLHDLDLPLGREREVVLDRDRVYELNGEEREPHARHPGRVPRRARA